MFNCREKHCKMSSYIKTKAKWSQIETLWSYLWIGVVLLKILIDKIQVIVCEYQSIFGIQSWISYHLGRKHRTIQFMLSHCFILICKILVVNACVETDFAVFREGLHAKDKHTRIYFTCFRLHSCRDTTVKNLFFTRMNRLPKYAKACYLF